MKTIMKNIFGLALFFLLSMTAIGQTDYSYQLRQDLVSIASGKYSVVNYYYCEFIDGNAAQIKVKANCPVDVMSRDNFVSIYTSTSIILLISTFMEAGMGMPDIQELDELIGDADLTFNFIMAKNGMQVQVITSEGQENITMTWADVLGE